MRVLLFWSWPCNASSNHARQVLLAHGIQQPNRPCHHADQHDREAANQPELGADVYLLAGRSGPLGRLRPSITDLAHVGHAAARKALYFAIILHGIRVLERARSVAAAVVRRALACRDGAVAGGQDAPRRDDWFWLR